MLTAGTSVRTRAVETALPEADTALGVEPVALIRTAPKESVADMAMTSIISRASEVLILGAEPEPEPRRGAGSTARNIM